MSKEDEEQPGKVQIKAILKGNAARAYKPAAMDGFKIADFQINPMAAKQSPEDYLKSQVSQLQSQVATLNGEIANLKKKNEQDSKDAHEKGVQEGKALGIKEGEKNAHEKFNAELKELQTVSAQTFENIAAQQKENFEKIENATAEIAVAVAKRVFCEEVAENPEIIVRVMKEAFTFLGQEENLKVKINPLDINSAEEKESFWKPVMGSLKTVEIILDESIARGGCLLESQNGSSIDMRVETIFKHLEEMVKQIYNSQSSQAPAQLA
jgi:flagellar assembly protein FliH